MAEGIAIINEVLDELVKTVKPSKVILFSSKEQPDSGLASFKLCVIKDTTDKNALRKQVYLAVDCVIPYDVVVYTIREWDELSSCDDTFAHQILQTGRVLYG